MRDPNRIYKFCNELARIWSQVPDWRFGQLITNITNDMQPPEFFYIEDDEMMKLMKSCFGEETEE